jgi:hypothetical protein
VRGFDEEIEKIPKKIIIKLRTMIVQFSTGQQFLTQKDAKIFFGNHYYRRLVKQGDIHFTNYKS